jgi:hypothetical protein
MNVGAPDAALEMLPKVLKPVRMAFTQDILFLAMLDREMGITLCGQVTVRKHLVRVNRCAFGHVLLNQSHQQLLFAVRNHLGHYLAVPLQHPENNRLASGPASERPMPFAANKGFIGFDGVKQRELAVNHLHVFTDKASHAPRCLVGHAKLPFQFLGRNAVAGRCEQIDGIKPKLKRRAAVLKRGAHCRVKMMPAKLAGIRPLCLNPEPLGLAGAFRARMVLAKTGFKQVLKANFVIREPSHELTNCNAGRFFLAVLIFHAPKIAETHTYVKGIIPRSDAGNQPLALNHPMFWVAPASRGFGWASRPTMLSSSGYLPLVLIRVNSRLKMFSDQSHWLKTLPENFSGQIFVTGEKSNPSG